MRDRFLFKLYRPMEIYLIRHTTPDVKKGICYGQSDIESTASFAEEGKSVCGILSYPLDAVYSSPLIRCSRLANLICENTQLKPVYDNRLMELNFGDWEMKYWNEIHEKKLNEWMSDFVNVKVPGGENYNELHLRTQDFFAELLKQPFRKVGIVTHGGIVRSVLSMLLGIPLKNSFRLQVDYSSVTKIDMNDSELHNKLVFHNKK
jgi:alpha-ribazole phosphatase